MSMMTPGGDAALLDGIMLVRRRPYELCSVESLNCNLTIGVTVRRSISGGLVILVLFSLALTSISCGNGQPQGGFNYTAKKLKTNISATDCTIESFLALPKGSEEGQVGRPPGELRRATKSECPLGPYRMMFDASANIYIDDIYNNRVLEFDPSATYMNCLSYSLEERDYYFEAGRGYFWGGMAISPVGNLYMVYESGTVVGA